jgi:hypothetical protein
LKVEFVVGSCGSGEPNTGEQPLTAGNIQWHNQ